MCIVQGLVIVTDVLGKINIEAVIISGGGGGDNS
jgi:hypothetical protein